MIRSCCKTTQAREINPILEKLWSFSKTSAEKELLNCSGGEGIV